MAVENKYPLVILECPECGELKAYRDPYAPVKDRNGESVDGWLITGKCVSHMKFVGAPLPIFTAEHFLHALRIK